MDNCTSHKSNLECFEAVCQVGQRKASNDKCVPVTLPMPVHHLLRVEVDVLRYNSCTVQIINSSLLAVNLQIAQSCTKEHVSADGHCR